jgi:hypothetical protein
MGLVNIEREWDRRIDCQICDRGARVEFEGRIEHTLMHKISMTNPPVRLCFLLDLLRNFALFLSVCESRLSNPDIVA